MLNGIYSWDILTHPSRDYKLSNVTKILYFLCIVQNLRLTETFSGLLKTIYIYIYNSKKFSKKKKKTSRKKNNVHKFHTEVGFRSSINKN